MEENIESKGYYCSICGDFTLWENCGNNPWGQYIVRGDSNILPSYEEHRTCYHCTKEILGGIKELY